MLLVFAASCLLATPRRAAAQDGGYPVQTTTRTQFVFHNGEVMRREGKQLTPLTQNVKLANGIKINYKSGIVEMPADKVNSAGTTRTRRDGVDVRPAGGVGCATPGSAAVARGEAPHGASGKFDTYTQRGPGFDNPAMQAALLNKKIELLTQKISLLSQGRTDLPSTKAIDDQLAQLDVQLAAPPAPATAPK
ncbi:MAG: hypothetical protein NVS3B25_25330 [Hymenobacter sp.]